MLQIGGRGANLNAVEATWNATNKQIQREIRRRNTEYATKRIIMYQATKRSIIRSMAFSAVRYLAGGLLSGKWKKWVQDYAY